MAKFEAIDAAIAAARAWRLQVQDDVPSADDPVTWAQSVSGLDLDDWQMAVLRSEAPKQLLLNARQTGKSTVVALRAAWIVKHGGKAFAIGPTQRQSSVIFTAMSEFLSADPTVDITRSTQTMLETANGGVGLCLPGDRPSGLRGLSLRHPGRSAMLLDECAFLRPGIWAAVSPMLAAAPDAEQLWLSTPSGPTGVFHDTWVNDDAWEKTRIRAEDCARIKPEFLASERRRLGEDMFRQEYEAEFVSTTSAFFSADLIANVFGDNDGEIGDVFEGMD